MVSQKGRPRRLGFLLLDGYGLMSVAAAMEPFRAANLFAPAGPLYEMQTLHRPGDEGRSSLGAAFPSVPYAQAAGALDMLFVVAGGDPMALRDPALFAWLGRQARAGVALGGISGGAVVLASAGLLEGYRFTAHWHHEAEIRAAWPALLLERRLFLIDRDRYTCAGGSSPLDMMHAVIARDHGTRFAQRIADWFIQTEIRPPDAPQQGSLAARYGDLPAAVEAAVILMESHIADPLDLGQLADLSGLSARQLQRQTRAATGLSVMALYRGIRLATARELLSRPGLTVGEVAQMTGFATQAHFAEAFGKEYGQAPSASRR
ncbi:GlxA family transcriptional regulator [Oceanicola sp. S124]|uniref:GlxA family transcriptional regulator n=1 Tax=Oceanicola sp. S124 TaxID=1042378 RepID=UPI00025593AF|nr:GlxA family transcriptional regulator [Oceanicola sp. S124]